MWRNLKRGVVLIVFLALLAFWFQPWVWVEWYFYPCQKVLTYSLGEIDERFNLSADEFRALLKEAESVWEEALGQDLFVFQEASSAQPETKSDLKINLIYDERQDTSLKLRYLGASLDDEQAKYDELKDIYEQKKNNYLTTRKIFEADLALFNQKQKRRLTQNEQRILLEEMASLKVRQQELQQQVDVVNNLANDLNQLAQNLNLGIDSFNRLGDNLEPEFEEGVYEVGPDKKEINIYHYASPTKLIRLVAHEFGHALGLGHLPEPEALMYYLNQSESLVLSSEDVLAFRDLCSRPKTWLEWRRFLISAMLEQWSSFKL